MKAFEAVSEAQTELDNVNYRLKNDKKVLNKDQKRHINENVKVVSKMIRKAKPDKMTEAEVQELKEAVEQLRNVNGLY